MIEFLKNLNVFSKATDKDLENIVKASNKVSFKRNRLGIFDKKSLGKGLIIVKKGVIKFYIKENENCTLVDFLGEDDIFVGYFSKKKYLFIPLTTEGEIIHIPIEKLDDILKNNVHYYKKLTELIKQNAKDLMTYLSLLQFVNKEKRITKIITILKEKHGENWKEISQNVTHKDIADLAGVTRESVTRILKRTKNKSLVKKQIKLKGE